MISNLCSIAAFAADWNADLAAQSPECKSFLHLAPLGKLANSPNLLSELRKNVEFLNI